MNDSYMDYLEMDQQQAESEMELYYSILDSLQKAKNLGLDDESLKVLCYIAGVEFDNLD
jgi:hypothetical protein